MLFTVVPGLLHHEPEYRESSPPPNTNPGVNSSNGIQTGLFQSFGGLVIYWGWLFFLRIFTIRLMLISDKFHS